MTCRARPEAARTPRLALAVSRQPADGAAVRLRLRLGVTRSVQAQPLALRAYYDTITCMGTRLLLGPLAFPHATSSAHYSCASHRAAVTFHLQRRRLAAASAVLRRT
jgi:hypothetical protein